MKEIWYTRSADYAIQFWGAKPDEGLSNKEAVIRLEEFGYNEILEKEKTPWWNILLAQFQDFMVLVLLGATLISALLGEYIDAITILSIVIINGILGFVQEYRAENSIEALKKLTTPTARVLRHGTIQQIPARELVPGDILVIEAGDRIAADGRLASVYNLEVEEAALTGESQPVRKIADCEFQDGSPLGDQKNMIFSGTSVIRGRGTAVICATGMATEVGHIADMIQTSDEKDTPLQQRLEHLGKLLVWGCLGVCLVVVISGLIKGEPILLMLMAGISLAVAAIPEGLPAIVTVALALGVQRMIKRNAIVRKLPAVETLGCTTVICSDKTGTLTQNVMTVRSVFTGSTTYEVSGVGYEIKGQFLVNKQEFDARKDKLLQQCLAIGALCNNSVLKYNDVSFSDIWRRMTGDKGNKFSVEGDPTEGALIVAAGKAKVWKADLEKTQKRIGEIPFESDRRRMSVVYRDPNGDILYLKGAPDTVLELCRYHCTVRGEAPLTPDIKASITAANDMMTSQALRVLAVAYRRLGRTESTNIGETIERELVFAGLIGMIDPPRAEVKAAIATCHQAGIKTIMITGDHPNTALAIAKELNMVKDGTNQSFTGKDIDAMEDKQLARAVNDSAVFARVSPAHKLRIVQALKRNGHIVAMTGDGVNDAPAIKEADIGIAMGLTGTDVTKEASSIILVDDNFATIVGAVEEGRGIYENIRKFIRYLLSCNTGEVLTMFIAALAGMPLPMLPVQLLWVNLVTDGLPAIALGIDPRERNIMNRPPRYPGESVFSRGLSRKILVRGVQIGVSTVLVFAGIYYLQNDLALARTMAFCTLVFCQMFHVFDCRSEFANVFELGLFSNRYLVAAVICSIAMQLTVIYLPFFNEIFETVPLAFSHWVVILSVSGWTMFLSFIKHYIFRRRFRFKRMNMDYSR